MDLGSLSKAVTATVIGALSEQHRMTWETTIGPSIVVMRRPGHV